MQRVEFDLESDRFEIVKGFFPLSLSLFLLLAESLLDHEPSPAG
jgi:hypothetical protein